MTASLDEILAELRPALRFGITALAERLLGEPTKTKKSEWRWGSKGSFRVIVSGEKRGACADFESGWKGDPLALIMREQHCDFISAVEYGCGFAGIKFEREDGQEEDQSARAAREAADKAERDQRKAEQEAEQEADEGKRIAYARRLWDASTPIDGTVAETYLTNTRAIPRPATGWPEAVRFYPGTRSLILAGTDADGAVKFVQRVRLTPEGRKIDATPDLLVKQTSGVMAGAVVRLPGAPDGPVLLAEGPETGLSLWTATGHETWMSIGSIAQHVPPTGRRVVICRDDDPQQSPADLALKRAMSGWLNLGPDLVVATPWQVRRHDKSDFNDLIQANGVEAVRDRISAALKPPHQPIHRVTVEEGRAAITATVADFYRQMREYDARRKQAAAVAKAELTAEAPFAAEVIAARRAWADASAASAEARRIAKLHPPSSEIVTKAKATARATRDRALIASEIAAEFKKETQKIQAGIRAEAKARGRAAAGPYPVHGIRVDVGTGKSRANLENVAPLIQELRAAKDKRAIAVAIPAHTLGDQQVDRLAATTNAVGISAGVWRSRRAPDPNHPDYLNPSIKKENKTRMCRDIDAVADAEEALSDVQNSVCRNPKTERQCAFFDECPFQKQKAAKHDVWFVAHELLFTGKPSEIGEIAALVVDESAWQDGLFGVENPNFLLLSTLTSEDATVPDSYLDTHQLQSTRKALSEAISTMEPPGEDDPRLPILKANVRSAGIDVAAANSAYALEWRRKIDAEIYPGMPAKKRKEAVKAVAHNKIVAKMGSIWKAVAHLVDDNGPDRSGWLSLGMSKRKEGTAPAIYIKGRHNVHQSWHVPTLLMDATMQPDLVKLFWPAMELTADVRVQTPHQHITQVVDRSYSKAQLAKASGLHDVHAIICREARRYAPKWVLAVVQAEVEEKLRELGMLPNNLQLAHHNNIAGHDEWGDVAALIVVGRTAPSPNAAAWQAEAITGTAINPLSGWYEKAETVREMADGTFRQAETDRHPDPIAEAVRWHIAEGELVQIIGRPRGVNRKEANPVDVLLMTNAPIPVPIERLISAADLDPSPADMMMAAGGVAFESPADAATAYPDLWATRKTATSAMGRFKEKQRDANRNKGVPITECVHLEFVTYQKAGPRFPKATCQIDPNTRPDAEVWLTEKLGTLAYFAVTETVPTPTVATIAAMSDEEKLALRARLHSKSTLKDQPMHAEAIDEQTEQVGLDPSRLYPPTAVNVTFAAALAGLWLIKRPNREPFRIVDRPLPFELLQSRLNRIVWLQPAGEPERVGIAFVTRREIPSHA